MIAWDVTHSRTQNGRDINNRTKGTAGRSFQFNPAGSYLYTTPSEHDFDTEPNNANSSSWTQLGLILIRVHRHTRNDHELVAKWSRNGHEVVCEVVAKWWQNGRDMVAKWSHETWHSRTRNSCEIINRLIFQTLTPPNCDVPTPPLFLHSSSWLRSLLQ